jgi:hypothetical protein
MHDPLNLLHTLIRDGAWPQKHSMEMWYGYSEPIKARGRRCVGPDKGCSLGYKNK